METSDVQTIVQSAIHEFLRAQQASSEPAHKAELEEERKRREQLERRLNELVEENKRTKQAAAEAERGAAIRAELQRLGVGKVDLAYRVVQDNIVRSHDGQLVAKTDQGEIGIKEFLASFVGDNPEFLPARIAGGAGIGPSHRGSSVREGFDIERIVPGMSAEDKERARQEILRLASQQVR
jgi:hypothetical protein